MNLLFSICERLPFIKQRITENIDKINISLRKSLAQNLDTLRIPDTGINRLQLIHKLTNMRKLQKIDYNNGKVSGTVYHNDKQLYGLIRYAFRLYVHTNPLHADVFPDIRKMETEVIRMCCNLYNGDANTCGSFTSGGTESILMACKAYREFAKKQGISKPEILCGESAHPAFDKAAHYFCMKIVRVKCDKETCKIDLNSLKKNINKNTVMIVGSVPSFPYGIIDPIEELSDICLKYDISLHVDCCLGGFLLPFMWNLDVYDFRLDGVTSISTDTHKYGYAPKGSSLILYRNKEYLQCQYFIQPEWQGGIYASPSIAGSRPGHVVACTWTVLNYMGIAGYMKATKEIIDTTMYIKEKIQEIDELFIFGDPQVSVIGIGSNIIDILKLNDMMTNLGWNLNALQYPSGIHICITQIHTKNLIADNFVNDIQKVVSILKKTPHTKTDGMSQIYGTAQKIPNKNIVKDITTSYLDYLYK